MKKTEIMLVLWFWILLLEKENFKYDENTNCEVFEKNKVLFIKSHWFMSLSGAALRQYTRRYNIKPENVIVIHDNVNLEFDEIMTRTEGETGDHNGLKKHHRSYSVSCFSENSSWSWEEIERSN